MCHACVLRFACMCDIHPTYMLLTHVWDIHVALRLTCVSDIRQVKDPHACCIHMHVTCMGPYVSHVCGNLRDNMTHMHVEYTCMSHVWVPTCHRCELATYVNGKNNTLPKQFMSHKCVPACNMEDYPSKTGKN